MGLLWYSPIWDTCRRPGTIWPKLRIHGIHGNGGFLRQPGIFLWDFQGSPTEPLRAMGTTTHDNFYHRMANPSYAWWHCMNKSHEVTCSHSEVFHLLQLLTAFSHLLILLQLPLHLVLSRLVEVSHHHLQKFSGFFSTCPTIFLSNSSPRNGKLLHQGFMDHLDHFQPMGHWYENNHDY